MSSTADKIIQKIKDTYDFPSPEKGELVIIRNNQFCSLTREGEIAPIKDVTPGQFEANNIIKTILGMKMKGEI